MIKKILSQIYRRLFNLAASYLPVKQQTVLFESFNGKIPCDNPYYIYLELREQCPEWQLYWGVKKQFVKEAQKNFPEIEIIARFSLKWLFLTTRAQFWVMNARMPFWLKKNKKTIYIQTWHGTPLKKLGIDIETVSMPGTQTSDYHQNFLRETARWDALIAPNRYSELIFKQAFGFENQFLELGYPRNDRLVANADNENEKERLKKAIFGKQVGNVILYAPTWRDDYFISKGNYRFYLPFNLEKVIKILGEKDQLIIRPHYLVGDTIDIRGFEDRVKICVTEDINELYLVSDLLITDYSSVMFDFAILKRPMLFYAYDMAHYQEKLRGFYFDYKDVPGPIVTAEDDFYYWLQQYYEFRTFDGFTEKENRFYEKYTTWEKGTASNEVVAYMKKKFKESKH